MKRKKWLWTLWTAISVMLCAGSLTACGNDELLGTPKEPAVLYELTADKKGVEVVGYDGPIQRANIADSYQGFRVVRIRENAFQNCDTLKSVTLPSTITEIGAHAFYDCDRLTSVTLNETIQVIGAGAFASCDQLVGQTYENANYLSTPTNPYFALLDVVDETMLSMQLHDDTKLILSDAFDGCTALNMLIFPAHVQTVFDGAFADCTALTTIYHYGTASDWQSVSVSANNAPLQNANVYFYSETQPSAEGSFWHFVADLPTVWEEIACSHTWVPTTVKPTCTQQGYDLWTCSKCGELGEKSNFTPPKHGTILNGICSSCEMVVGSDGVQYTISYDGTYATVTGYKGMDTEVYIADTYNGVPVTTIGYQAFYLCTGLTRIVIPYSVTTIGEYAFTYCHNLTIYCEATSKPSGWDRDWNSSNRPVVWGYKVTESVVYELSSDGTYATVTGYTGTNTKVVIAHTYNGVPVTTIGDDAFNNCHSLTSIVIPNSVTTIGDSAFLACTSLTSVVIPNSVATIENAAFYHCTSLTSIVIPNSVTTIGVGTFAYCYRLTSIVIPNSVTTIESSTFENCPNLTSVVIPNSVTTIEAYAFLACSNLTIYCEATSKPSGWSTNWNDSNCSVIWGYIKGTEGVVYKLSSDGAYAIVTGYTGTATEVYIANTYNGVLVTTIGGSAFHNCDKLTSVIIPDGVTTIRGLAFYSCSNLTSVIIPDSLTSIGDNAFCDCNSLTSIVIPDTVTSIGNYAFYSCDKLTSVIIPESVTSIGEKAFYWCNCLTISCEAETQPSGWNSNWNFSNRPVVWGYTEDMEGVSYKLSSDGTCVIVTGYKGTATEIVITGTYNGVPVTMIRGAAFYNCDSVKSVIIPDSVTSIGDSAFYSCDNLTSVVIPDNVTSIGDYAFYSCDKLTSIVIPSSVTSIDNSAFADCANLTIYCEATSRPSGWNSNWNPSNRPVIWGYKGE